MNNILFINGNTKEEKNASASLCEYLAIHFEKKNVSVHKYYVDSDIDNENVLFDMLTTVENSEMIIFSSTIYSNGLPPLVLKTMKYIKGYYETVKVNKTQYLLALCNYDFTENSHTHIAINIYKNFAKELNITWYGNLNYGMGNFLNGKPLSELGLMYKNVKKALELTACAIAEDKNIPLDAEDLIQRPSAPNWMYSFMNTISHINKTKNKPFLINSSK